ncbi:MAG TPA: hypothetical protein VFS55_08330 [Dokdonella sp.]|nr:hypothetical protein [Dokdonella sp.]
MPHVDIYVRISPNAFHARNVSSGLETKTVASTPFTTSRLLVGEFTAAELVLSAQLASLAPVSLFRSRRIVMHPLAMIDGGLSEVEARVLLELAESCGASRAVVWTGPMLSDDAVARELRATRGTRVALSRS